MSTPLNNTDGFVEIYEMSAGGQGNIVNPSGGWEYVQGISLSEAPVAPITDRVGATYQRSEWLGAKTSLEISRFHVGGDEYSFANDHSKDYLIKLLFYDSLAGVPEGSAQIIQLAYCRSMDRALSTGKQANIVSRKWFVGEQNDNVYEDTTTMIWTPVALNGLTTQTVNHYRGTRPFVWFADASGNKFQTALQHLTDDTFIIKSARALVGFAYYA